MCAVHAGIFNLRMSVSMTRAVAVTIFHLAHICWMCFAQADELRDRLSDVDRTNSDASAAEMTGLGSETASGTTSRFGVEASGGSGSMRSGSSASLKRTREVEESAPLALRLDALAGPALETSFRTDRGVSEVSPPLGLLNTCHVDPVAADWCVMAGASLPSVEPACTAWL